MRRVLALLAAAASVAGCRSYDATELMVEVRTKNLEHPPDPPPFDIDAIEVRIMAVDDTSGPVAYVCDAGAADAGLVDAAVADGGAADASAPSPADAGIADAAPFPAHDAGASPSPCAPDTWEADGLAVTERWCGLFALPMEGVPPIQLGIVPRSGDESHELIEIRAVGFLEGVPVVRSRRLASFVPHRRIYLAPIVLSRGCTNGSCPCGEACNDDHCVSISASGCTVGGGDDAGPAWSSCGADGDASVVYADGSISEAGTEAGPTDAGDVEGGVDMSAPPPPPPPPPDPCAGAHCGDGRCNCGESYSDCPGDCYAHMCDSHCGNGSCQPACTETCASCPADCC